MSERIDARGLSCPQPVLLTKRTIDRVKQGAIEVLVDSATSKENVSRLARSLGFSVAIEEIGGEYKLNLKK